MLNVMNRSTASSDVRAGAPACGAHPALMPRNVTTAASTHRRNRSLFGVMTRYARSGRLLTRCNTTEESDQGLHAPAQLPSRGSCPVDCYRVAFTRLMVPQLDVVRAGAQDEVVARAVRR